MRHELEKIKDLLMKLSYVLSKQQKQYGVVVLFAAIVSSVLEMLGVASILPMVEGLMDVEALQNKFYIRPIVNLFQIKDSNILIYIVCGGIIVIYVIKNAFSIFYLWLVKKYTFKINRELGTRVMESYMAQGYIFFVDNNSAKLLRGISGDVAAVDAIVSSLFNLVIKAITILAIGVYILAMEPFIAISLMLLSGLCVLLIQIFFKKSMLKYGELRREASWTYTQTCLEMIQGIKEVLVMGREEYFKKKFVDSVNENNKYTLKIEMATTMPAYIIETASIVGLLLALILQVTYRGFSADTILNLSAIAVGAFRILPSVGAISSTFNSIRSQIPSFNVSYETIKIVNELETDLRTQQKRREFYEGDIELRNGLTIENVFYKYPDTSEYILKDVSLEIRAKSSIGLIGTSGAGKSTFVDVLLGLLEPESGQILFDGIDIETLGKHWNRNIGYVPQSIYLVDGNIRANIAFGIPEKEIDDEEIWRALEMAQLSEFVKAQPKGLDTRVGEWGIKFSGGQRQRVAIARALYANPEILVLDEATAALDNETESALMEAIDALQGEKTLIVVAHRLTTIKRCDYIYEVKDGKLIERSKEEVFSKE